MVKLFVKNVKEGPLGKLTESIRNNNISQKYGFVVLNWLLTIIADTLAIFDRQIFEKCAKIVRIAKSMINFFLTVDCVSNHINE